MSLWNRGLQIVLACFAMSVTFAASAHALPPDSEPAVVGDAPDWTVQVDPLTTALGFEHLQFETVLDDARQFSLYVGPHLRLFDGILGEQPTPFVGWGAEVGFRWYFQGSAPKGAWVLVRGVGAFLQTTDGSEETGFGGYGSALVGYTWILDQWLVLSGGAGGQFLHYHIKESGPKGFLIALHTAIGVAF